ncbi:MAG TPA: FAD-binding protein, partial [Desulfobacteraceae bacterium]|nr:FAD-binding protein [Desulfobacteraceae bacterium]
MSDIYDIVIIGAGPGGLGAGIIAAEAGKSYIILEKGKRVLQGIIDSYPKGKKVYPTIPKSESDPFPIEALVPPKEKIAVETYVGQIETYVQSQQINIKFEE